MPGGTRELTNSSDMPRTGALESGDLVAGVKANGAPAAFRGSLFLAAAAGTVGAVTWTGTNGLSTISGTRTGQPGYVSGPDAGTHTDPVTSATVPNVGEYVWSGAAWRWVRDLTIPDADAVRALLRLTPRINANYDGVMDWKGIFGGGPAFYVPTRLVLASPSGDTFSTTTTGEGGGFPAHKKIPLNTTNNLQTVYYDRQNDSFEVAVWPTRMPIDPDRYFHIISRYTYGVISSIPFIETWDRDWSVTASRPFAYDPYDKSLYVPHLEGWFGTTGWDCAPPAGSLFRKITVPDTTFHFVVLDCRKAYADQYDPNAISARGGYSADNPRPVAAGGGVILLGSVWNRKFTPLVPFAEMATLVRNEFGASREDNDKADNIYGFTEAVPLQRPESLALGFTRGWADLTGSDAWGGKFRSFYGGFFKQPANCGQLFMRFFVETDVEGSFGDVRYYLQATNADGTGHNQAFTPAVSRDVSTYVREYLVYLKITTERRWLSTWVGVFDHDGAGSRRVFGLQYALSPHEKVWIPHRDCPRAADEIGTRLRALESGGRRADSFEPMLPLKMYFHPERSYQFYPEQMFGELPSFDLVVESNPGGLSPVLNRTIKTESFSLDAESIGASVRFGFSDLTAARTTKLVFPVTSAVLNDSDVAALNVKTLVLGDSLNDWNGAYVQSVKRLRAMGATVTTIGTMVMESDIPGDGTELGEARSGREFADFIYMNTDAVSPIADAPVAWGNYLALTKGSKRAYNPFLKVPSSDDTTNRADMIYNGYIFDMRFYLNRAGFDDPDLVDINLHTNDISQQEPARSLLQIAEGFRIIVHQTRRALPNAKICVHYNANGRYGTELRWQTEHWAGLKEILKQAYALGDDNLFIIPNYCTINRDSGFIYSAVPNEFGAEISTLSDGTHYAPQGLREYGEVTAQYWAGALTE